MKEMDLEKVTAALLRLVCCAAADDPSDPLFKAILRSVRGIRNHGRLEGAKATKKKCLEEPTWAGIMRVDPAEVVKELEEEDGHPKSSYDGTWGTQGGYYDSKGNREDS